MALPAVSTTRLDMFAARNSIFTGQQSPVGQEVLTAASGTWTCPANVFSVCVVQVGKGGGPSDRTSDQRGGCAGGSLTYRNDMPVVPGTGYGYTINSTGSTIFGITAGAGETSVNANGANPKASSGPYTALFAGGNGGSGTSGGANGVGGGAGGAGGYSAAGGNGGTNSANGSAGGASAGGGGGGGNADGAVGGQGGGVGLLGAGSNGTGGAQNNPTGDSGNPGSGGSGTTYGGGCGGNDTLSQTPGPGGIRIIWGTGRAYPSTRTADE